MRLSQGVLLWLFLCAGAGQKLGLNLVFLPSFLSKNLVSDLVFNVVLPDHTPSTTCSYD